MCYYCPESSDSFETVINHTVQYHSSLILKTKKATIDLICGKMGYLTKNFNITPQYHLLRGEKIKPSETSETIEIIFESNSIEQKGGDNYVSIGSLP